MAERFIRTWKNKICKYMILVSKNLYINTVSKYNNTYHNTIKTNPVDVKSSKHIDFNKENNEEDLKFKVGYRLKKLKYKSLFAKYYNLNWSEEIFVIKKIKNTVLWPYILVVWTVKKLWEHFTKKNYKKNNNNNKKEFRVEKVIKRKCDQPYVNRKSYGNSFKSWIDKKIRSINEKTYS